MNFVDLMVKAPAFPCVSTITLFELRKRLDVYDKFLEVFSILPFLLIKPQNQVFEQELLNYPRPKTEEIISFSFSFLRDGPNAQPRPFLEKLFSDPGVLEVGRNWNLKWKKESAQNILSLKKNFVPKFKGANSNDAKRFVREAFPQYVLLTATD